MVEFLESIGIYDKGTTASDGSYVIDIADSNTYGKYLSRLDHCDELEEDAESSQITSGPSSIQYIGDVYSVTLLADFEADTYKLIIREN